MAFPHSGKCRSHVEHGEDAEYCTGFPCTMRFIPPAMDEETPEDPAGTPRRPQWATRETSPQDLPILDEATQMYPAEDQLPILQVKFFG